MSLFSSLRAGRSRKSADEVHVSEKGGIRSLHLGSDTVQSSMRIAAPFELALEEARVERRVRFVERVDAAQLQQVPGALDRVAEHPVPFVHARGRLQREPARSVAGRRVAIRVHGALQLAVRAFQGRRVDRVARRQAEELEVVAREDAHRIGGRRTTKEAARGRLPSRRGPGRVTR